MPSTRQRVVWRVLTTAAALVMGELTLWLLTRLWRAVRGDEPPRNPGAPGTDRAASIRWAIASGAAVAVSHLVARRLTAEAWRAATGRYPTEITDVAEATG